MTPRLFSLFFFSFVNKLPPLLIVHRTFNLKVCHEVNLKVKCILCSKQTNTIIMCNKAPKMF